MKRNKILIFLLALMWTMSLHAGTPLDDFVHDRRIDTLSTALMIVDLSNGEVVAEYNGDKPLIPASIKKATTTAALLSATGEKYRYETKVYATGKIKNNVLEGNLLVEASGDPSINSSAEPLTNDFCLEIADVLAKHHIDSIAGRIVVDQHIGAGPAVPPSWASGDLSHSYGTGCHPFNFENNSRGKSSVSSPVAIFETRLRDKLRSCGIRIGGNKQEEEKRKLLLTHYSAPIDEIMRSCMMRSDNLFAESLLRTLALEKKGVYSTEAGADVETSFWSKKGVDVDDVRIIDGSGLSRSNRVTARFMTDVLEEMSGNPWYASFFPLAGQEGTLKKFLAGTPLDSYIALKTGSMNGIQCYAGYKLDDNYMPTHTVVVIINKLPQGRAEARKAVEELLLSLLNDENN